MSNQEIRIKPLTVDDNDVYFQILLKNETSSASLDFHGYTDEFQEFGSKLKEFPKTIVDEITFQVGEDDPKWAYFLKLRVFCSEPNGHSSIHVVADNHGIAPNFFKSEFFIRSVPASLNKLGNLLTEWKPIEGSELVWFSEE